MQNYRKVSNRNKADALKAITALKLQMDEELKTARTNADVDAVLKRFNVALSDIEAVITEKKIAYCELITLLNKHMRNSKRSQHQNN